MASPEEQRTVRWQKRRAEILRVAERIFAERGYAGTRLEDLGRRVGMRRASLVYYFRSKDELYEATVEQIFGEVLEWVEASRTAPDPLSRLESIVSAWIRFLGERPHAGRLFLREVVDAIPKRKAVTVELRDAILSGTQEILDEGQQRGVFRPLDMVQYAMLMMGATLFYVSSRPLVQRAWSFDPLSPENLERHRQMLLSITRHLLVAPPEETPE